MGSIAPVDRRHRRSISRSTCRRRGTEDRAAGRQREQRSDSGRADDRHAMGPRIDSAERAVRARRVGSSSTAATRVTRCRGTRRGAPAAAPPPPDWTTNDEALTNFAYAQMKKTHDVAVALVARFYGEPIRHSYYLGSSQGGREALIVTQRFPQDYDGVFAQVPANTYVQLSIGEPLARAKIAGRRRDGFRPRRSPSSARKCCGSATRWTASRTGWSATTWPAIAGSIRA